MFRIYVIVSEIIINILFAAFIRIDSNNQIQFQDFNSSLIFLIGFALFAASRKKLAWTSFGNLIIIIAVSFQWCLLWCAFWNSCMQGFTTTYYLSMALFVQCLFCTLCILLTTIDLIGKVFFDELIYISLILTIGFSLNSAVINYGLNTFDGGGCLQVFLFSALFTFGIWFITSRNVDNQQIKNYQSDYDSNFIGLIGLLFIVYAWPGFNAAGSQISSLNTKASTVSGLVSSAIVNTILSIISSILFTFILQQNKLKRGLFIECIISGGIIISSAANLILDPVAAIILGCLASILTQIIFKYFSQNYFIRYYANASIRLIFGFLGAIFTAIFLAARINKTPVIVDSPYRLGGLVIASIFITFIIAFPFGCLCGLMLKFVKATNLTQITLDQQNWQLKQIIVQVQQKSKLEQKLYSSVKNSSLTHRSNKLSIRYNKQVQSPINYESQIMKKLPTPRKQEASYGSKGSKLQVRVRQNEPNQIFLKQPLFQKQFKNISDQSVPGTLRENQQQYKIK